MKTLRLLLLGLLTPLLCGSVFAFDLTTDEVDYLDNNSITYGSFSNQTIYILKDFGSRQYDLEYCVVFSGLSFNSTASFSIFGANNPGVTENNFTQLGSVQPYFLYCSQSNNVSKIVIATSQQFPTSYMSADKYWVLYANKITNGYLGFDVQGLLDSYSNCQIDLNNCDTITNQCLEDKSTLSGQLATCNSDKESLTNYNEALSTQLNECLNNQGSGVNLSGLVLNNNSLFWYLDDSLLSLPINNNLFLPLGYQGALDSGNVLYIKAIDEEEPENYYITPEDKVSIIDILSYIFVFFLGIGIIFSLIKLFKKIFTH